MTETERGDTNTNTGERQADRGHNNMNTVEREREVTIA